MRLVADLPRIGSEIVEGDDKDRAGKSRLMPPSDSSELPVVAAALRGLAVVGRAGRRGEMAGLEGKSRLRAAPRTGPCSATGLALSFLIAELSSAFPALMLSRPVRRRSLLLSSQLLLEVLPEKADARETHDMDGPIVPGRVLAHRRNGPYATSSSLLEASVRAAVADREGVDSVEGVRQSSLAGKTRTWWAKLTPLRKSLAASFSRCGSKSMLSARPQPRADSIEQRGLLYPAEGSYQS